MTRLESQFAEWKSSEVERGGLVTPVDEFSGIPLPLSPTYMEERPSRFPGDDHHPWHERNDPLLKTLSGRALRSSRVQHTNYDAHHLDYHGSFHGPLIPENEEDQRRPIILAAAGYIPETAISFTNTGEPEIVRIPEKVRKRLWASKLIRVEQQDPLRKYLTQLILGQDLSDVKPSTIDEFLYTGSKNRKKLIGDDLLGRAMRQATEPVQEQYYTAFKSHQLPGDRPKIASRFALAALGLRRYRTNIHERMREQLIERMAA